MSMYFKMDLIVVSLSILTVSFFVRSAIADTILISDDSFTIQSAIDAAANGDTILVAPGNYMESINYLGKAITVVSESGSAVTTIDSGEGTSVVTFENGEGRDSVLSGFTVRNAFIGAEGGGIRILNSSPTIIGNVIRDNRANGGGAGIYIRNGSPLVQDNIITNNEARNLGYGGGIRIGCCGTSSEIRGNTISYNTVSSREGGGIYVDSASGIIINNLIIGNSVVGGNVFTSFGGGIGIGSASPRISQNLIIENSAISGGGISLNSSTAVMRFINNTVANNHAQFGSAFYSNGQNKNTLLVNNAIIGSEGETAFFCGTFGFNTPIFEFNDIFSSSSDAFGGNCVIPNGTNISAEPMFVDPVWGNYRPQLASPLIDTGDNTAFFLPATDLDDNIRIFDGDDSGIADVDIGAYEFLTAPAQIDSLIAFVMSLNAKNGAKTPILGKLDDALNHLIDSDPNNDGSVDSLIQDVIDLAEKKSGHGLEEGDAEEIIARAERILVVL